MSRKKVNNNKSVLSIDNIKDLLKIFTKLTRRRKRKRVQKQKIKHQSGDGLISSSSMYKVNEIDKKLGEKYNQLTREDAKNKQIVIHNNLPPIVINQDATRLQGALNSMLENGTVTNDEYEKLKKGDPLIFKKIFDENAEFRKLLIDTHEEKVDEHDKAKNLEALKDPETKERIYNLKKYEDIHKAIATFSAVLEVNDPSFNHQNFFRELVNVSSELYKDVQDNSLTELRKLAKIYNVSGSVAGGVDNLVARIVAKHLLLNYYDMLDYVEISNKENDDDDENDN